MPLLQSQSQQSRGEGLGQRPYAKQGGRVNRRLLDHVLHPEPLGPAFPVLHDSDGQSRDIPTGHHSTHEVVDRRLSCRRDRFFWPRLGLVLEVTVMWDLERLLLIAVVEIVSGPLFARWFSLSWQIPSQQRTGVLPPRPFVDGTASNVIIRPTHKCKPCGMFLFSENSLARVCFKRSVFFWCVCKFIFTATASTKC